ncbi:cell division protein FtsA [Pelistega europaea]|uniref:Cell division protein FtsA n=1 Tax=Pelistega europaea TaxID=106147 RepID=A0A7Y4L927_9BURK|nr:cell division protein FtsA [Pelistega europaea]NOL49232.1 cell division protein FtsA [Pelistega europaea]
MTRDLKRDLIVALDIGTSKVVAVVAEALPEHGRFEVLGLGQAPTQGGIRNGSVINIDITVRAIQKALEEAELMADCKIRDAMVGINGAHIVSFNSSGMVAIRDKEVTAIDVNRVIDTAKAVNISNDQRILHVITQQFIVDRQEGISRPEGMAGVRLEVRVHIVTGEETAAQNILKCVRRCGLEPYQLTLNPLAASEVCLSDDEKQQGVLLIDIGAGTTGFTVYKDGFIRHSHIFPEGGQLVTSDLAKVFHIPVPEAEDLKLENGIAKPELVSETDVVTLSPVGDQGRQERKVSHQIIGEVISCRLVEIFESIQSNLEENELVPHSIVLTGGGSLLPGIADLAEEVFQIPAKVGRPLYYGSLADVVAQPQFATVMGLLLQARLQLDEEPTCAGKRSFWKKIVDYVLN